MARLVAHSTVWSLGVRVNSSDTAESPSDHQADQQSTLELRPEPRSVDQTGQLWFGFGIKNAVQDGRKEGLARVVFADEEIQLA